MKGGKDADELEHEFGDKDEITPKHMAYEPVMDEAPDSKDKPQPVPDLKDADDLDLNRHLSAKVLIPKDGHTFANGRVVRRARDSGGQLVGKSHNNPILDTSVYEVEFEDGSVEKYNANIIAEHIYAQLDDDG